MVRVVSRGSIPGWGGTKGVHTHGEQPWNDGEFGSRILKPWPGGITSGDTNTTVHIPEESRERALLTKWQILYGRRKYHCAYPRRVK